MAPRKKTAPEGELCAAGGDALGLQDAVVEALRCRLAQSLDLQALRPAVAAAAAQRLLDDGIATKLSVDCIAQEVANSLAKEFAQEDSGLKCMLVEELVAKLVR